MTPKRASVPFDEVMDRLLRDRPALGPEMVRGALEEATDAEGRLVLRWALRRVVTARGHSQVAAAAGLSPAALTRALSDRGNPTLDTLSAVLAALGLELTVRAKPDAATAKKRKRAKPAAVEA